MTTAGQNGAAPKSALLILVHGSPRPTANTDMYRVAELCRQRGDFAVVQEAFLECNEPSIPDAVRMCVERGVNRIVAVPYFLHTGTHVADDLPSLLEEAQKHYPAVEFFIGPFLGKSEIVTNILQDRTEAVSGAV